MWIEWVKREIAEGDIEKKNNKSKDMDTLKIPYAVLSQIKPSFQDLVKI
jgi:hypothetical protein